MKKEQQLEALEKIKNKEFCDFLLFKEIKWKSNINNMWDVTQVFSKWQIWVDTGISFKGRKYDIAKSLYKYIEENDLPYTEHLNIYK